jgi:hypothetical protein
LAAIEAIRDVDRLEALCERIRDSDVRDWNNLLGAPTALARRLMRCWTCGIRQPIRPF